MWRSQSALFGGVKCAILEGHFVILWVSTFGAASPLVLPNGATPRQKREHVLKMIYPSTNFDISEQPRKNVWFTVLQILCSLFQGRLGRLCGVVNGDHVGPYIAPM